MPVTYTLIASNTLTSGAAAVTFSAIPSTYTDLVLRTSIRVSGAYHATGIGLHLNGSLAANYSMTTINGTGTAGASYSLTNSTNWYLYSVPGASATSNTFSSNEVYIPNYAGSTNKQLSSFSVSENNSTTANQTQISGIAHLRSVTDAITSITVDTYGDGTMVSGSSFFLYGIKNS